MEEINENGTENLDDMRGRPDDSEAIANEKVNREYDDQAVTETLQFVNKVNELSAVFDELCQARHDAGQQEYGKLTFLGNDVVRMMIEELADTANYCRYQSIKLLLLQEQLSEFVASSGLAAEDTNDVVIGMEAFRGVKDVGWKRA